MPTELDSALLTYLTLVQNRFHEAQAEYTTQEGLHVLLSKEQLLARVVAGLETTHAFGSFVAATDQEFPAKIAGLRFAGESDRRAKAFFRLSGVYQALFEGAEVSPTTVIQQYRAALRPATHRVTYLAPLELVSFGQDKIDCGDFFIQQFSQEALDEMFCNSARQVFYRSAYIDSSELGDYWFLGLSEALPAEQDADSVNWYFDERVLVSYSEYPTAIQSALRRLALYDWGAHIPRRRPEGQLPAFDKWDGPFRPEIPFVITCPDSPIASLPPPPDLSKLAKEPWIDSESGEQLGEMPLHGVYLDESETIQFQAFMQHAYILLQKLEPHRERWRFADTALGFLLKGFLADGLEQLLWNITAVEAVLGEKADAGVVKLLLTRISNIFGQTAAEKKEIRKRFDNLYSYRSDLVHGNASLCDKSIYLGHLSEARAFARSVVLWGLEYLAHLADTLANGAQSVPPRETLLSALDVDEADRQQTQRILAALPGHFPNVENWLNPVPIPKRGVHALLEAILGITDLRDGNDENSG